jgi:hypothetical protein
MNNPEHRTAEDWYAQARLRRVEEIRRQARRLYGQSSLLADMGNPEAEAVARRMLGVAASAFWNAEDTELEESVHREMDLYGEWVRTTFGCHLAYESGNYFQRCPVAIAHKRIGMSIGFVARKRICSICAGDWADCPHSSSELYEVCGGTNPAGYCRVCGIQDCSKHLPGQAYRTPPIAIVTEIERLNEISLVPKPAQPDARLTSIPVSTEELRARFGPPFLPGYRVNCDRCLSPCEGIEEIQLPS